MRYALGSLTAGLLAAAVVLAAAPATSATPSAGSPVPVQGTVADALHDGRVTVAVLRGDALGPVSVRGWSTAAVQLNGHPAAATNLAVGTTIIAAGHWDRSGGFVANRVRALTPVATLSGLAGHIVALDGPLNAVMVRSFDGKRITGYVQPLPFLAPTGARRATFAELRVGELVRLVGNADSAPDGQMVVTAAYPGMPAA